MSVIQFEPGQVVGRDFRILHELGQGGMGVVYVAEQLSTGRLRALKLMQLSTATEGNVQRFQHEARIGAEIDSEHIVDVVAAGVDEETGAPWLVMELLEGHPLSDYMSEKGPLSLADTGLILSQICAGLGAAHDVRVVHRDIKPDNVFLSRSSSASSGYIVKLLDFGIAKLTDQNVSNTVSMGSPFWMAPEQTERRPVVVCATDVWPLGLLAFHMLTGGIYWRTAYLEDFELAAFMRELVLEDLPAPSLRAEELGAPPLPEWFDAWFARCLERDLSARFRNAREAWSGFRDALVETGGTPPRISYGDSLAPIGPMAKTVASHAAIGPIVGDATAETNFEEHDALSAPPMHEGTQASKTEEPSARAVLEQPTQKSATPATTSFGKAKEKKATIAFAVVSTLALGWALLGRLDPGSEPTKDATPLPPPNSPVADQSTERAGPSIQRTGPSAQRTESHEQPADTESASPQPAASAKQDERARQMQPSAPQAQPKEPKAQKPAPSSNPAPQKPPPPAPEPRPNADPKDGDTELPTLL